MKRVSVVSALVMLASTIVVAGLGFACGSSPGTDPGHPNPNNPNGDDASAGGDDGGTAPPPLGPVGEGGPKPGTGTSISGVAYDPAAKNPLYNVVVYVPSKAPSALPKGASCDSCASLYTGDPVASALTDTKGHFTLTNVPDGADVPLVIQIGKWRRQLKIATVARGIDNPQPDKSLRLPKNGAEGDIPSMAVSTGAADSLECLLRRVGLDAAEYASATGHVHIFRGSNGPKTAGPVPDTTPTAPTSTASLWDKTADLMGYDILLLSCEGQETTAMNQQALVDYTTAGGRVFASHFHYSWFNSGPFGAQNLATWTAPGGPIGGGFGSIGGTIVQTLSDGGVFPKGKALDEWLGTVKALDTNGELQIYQSRHNADVGPANTPSQAWIAADQASGAQGATQYFSFNTPVGAPIGDAGEPLFCGRVVYSDLHVGAGTSAVGGQDYPDYPFTSSTRTTPTGCVDRDLSAQEKALEFMLFDLSSCVTSDSKPPPPPPPVK